MGDEPILRPARRDDLPLIVQLRDALNALELRGSPHAPIRRLSVPEFDELWGATIGTENSQWTVIELGPKLIGFGLIYLVPKPPPAGAFIQWAYVEESERRHGLGQKLLDHMTAWARDRGANRIELQFIEGNETARRFWTKLGFRPYAQRCVRYM